jgi:hypothetical protein
MLSNVILFVLFVLVVIAYVSANVIMSVIAIKDDNTITDLLSEQDFGLGKIGVGIMYWPTFVALYIKSLLPINTSSCFDEEEFEEVDDNPFNLKYYTLAEILALEPSTKLSQIIITPKNYYDILKYAKIANKNKDIIIDIDNQTIKEDYLDDGLAFYGVRIGLYYKCTQPSGIDAYYVSCFHAIRSKVATA